MKGFRLEASREEEGEKKYGILQLVDEGITTDSLSRGVKVRMSSTVRKQRIMCDGSWKDELKILKQAGHSGSRLYSQHFGRPRPVDHEVKRSRPSWSTC